MTPFTDRFKELNFPLLGLVRLPEVDIGERRAEYGIKPGASSTTTLKAIVWRGYGEWKKRGHFTDSDDQRVKDRLRMEFEVFEKTGIVNYLLLVWDILKFADERGIPRGPGRGSVAGSLSAALSGITKVNPIKHNLNFTRFISEARAKPKIVDGILYASGKNLCDIDIDVSFRRREEILSYIDTKYPGRVAKISNRQELTGKMALKGVLKTYLSYTEPQARAISNFLEPRFGKVPTIDEGLKEVEAFRNWVESSPVHREAIDLARKIEGATITHGVHASGILISYHPVEGNIPIELSKNKELVTSYDMTTISECGIKLDLLALRTLDLIDETCKQVGIKMDDIDVDDPSIYQYFAEGKSLLGLFQVEAGLTEQFTLRIKPRNIDDISACLAISRPGALKEIDTFVKYVQTGEKKPIYPAIDAVLSTTGGIILYQEQINDICQQVYGMSATDSDLVRASIGKKIKEDMAKWEPVLYVNGKERGIPETVTKYFWDTCNASADYLFNRNHSCCYATITAQTTYLKANHPKEFLLSMFRLTKYDTDPQARLTLIINECRKLGFSILPPDLTKSGDDFELDKDGAIRFGLEHIKGISEANISKLGVFRAQSFITPFDYFDAAKSAKLPISIVTSLIYAGCITFPDTPRSKLAFDAQLYNLLTDKEKRLVHVIAESEHVTDLLALIKSLPIRKDEKGKVLLKDTRLATLRRDQHDYWQMYQKNGGGNEALSCYLYERALLGYSYSAALHSIYSKTIVNIVPLSEVIDQSRKLGEAAKEEVQVPREKGVKTPSPPTVSFVAFLQDIKRHVSQRDGRPYLKMMLEDDSGSLKGLLHGDHLTGCEQFHGRLPEDGDLAHVKGSLSRDGSIFHINQLTIQQTPVAFKRADVAKALPTETEDA